MKEAASRKAAAFLMDLVIGVGIWIAPISVPPASDLEAYPVWQYTNADGAGETLVRPIMKVPVKNLTGKVIGTQIRFANGTHAWALIGNVDVANPLFTEHFLTLSIERGGTWFALARYHDHDYADRGPGALSRFLGLQVDEVFPIGADIRPYVQGDPPALVISVPKEAQEKLTRADLNCCSENAKSWICHAKQLSDPNQQREC